MVNLHSTYSGDSSTALVLGITISNVVVPSVVDGILLFTFRSSGGLNPGDATFGAGGSQQFTILQTTSGVQTWFLPRPNVGTYNLVVGSYGSSRGAVFAMLLVGTKTTGYNLGSEGGTGTSSIWVGGPIGGGVNGSDIDFSIFTFANRDTTLSPVPAPGVATLLNLLVNSGGGASSYGFVVYTQPHSNFIGIGWTTTIITATYNFVALSSTVFNAPGTLTIRHAP